MRGISKRVFAQFTSLLVGLLLAVAFVAAPNSALAHWANLREYYEILFPDIDPMNLDWNFDGIIDNCCVSA